MTTLTYTHNGLDPVDAGGSVGPLRLYPTEARTGAYVSVEGAVRASTGVYRFDVSAVPFGRYWPSVEVVAADGEPADTFTLPPVDHPDDPHLVVSRVEVMRRLGIDTPTDEQWEQVGQALADAQADVEGYLGRSVVAQALLVEAAVPGWGEVGGWPGTGTPDWRRWPVLADPPDRVTVVSAIPREDGLYDLTVAVGLDGRHDPALAPIRRYIVAHAMNDPAVLAAWRAGQPDGGKVVRTVSAEGQSLSWALSSPTGAETVARPGSGEPGGLPLLASLDRWRKRTVWQRRGAPYPQGAHPVPWPSGGGWQAAW